MNIEFHATIIAQKYVQRELIRASTEIQRRSYDESTDVTDLIDYAEAEIFKVSEGHIKRDIQSASLVFDKAMKAIEEAHAQGGTMNGVPTGFTRLDQPHAGMAALRPHHHRSPSLDGQDRLRPLHGPQHGHRPRKARGFLLA